KNIEWVKDKLKRLKKHDLEMWKQSEPNSKNQSHFNGSMSAIDKALDFLDQLDEPEVLSSDWISKNVEYAYFDMLDGSGRLSSATAIIKPEKLQNLLVPKQEVSMIPNYVAKWISRHHEQFDLYPALKRLENNMSSWENVYEWYRENTRNFVNAYLTGEYEIEQEPKYYAKIKGHENIGSNDKYWNYNTDMEELSIVDSEVYTNVISEYKIKATKDEWANLGITDDNADFELVEELEERKKK